MKNYLDDPTIPLPIAALLNDIQRAFQQRWGGNDAPEEGKVEEDHIEQHRRDAP